jgi:hypothetical protein
MPARTALLLTLLAGLIAVPAGAATGDSIAGIPEALDSWSPTDGAWAVTNSEDTEGSRGQCEEGQLVHFANAAGETAGMVWARCSNPADAAALLQLTWTTFGMFPATGIAPAFGEDLELVSPYPGFDGVNRLWTQGEWFVTVARSCAALDDGCSAVTASYAQSLAAIVGVPVEPVVAVERLDDDYFSTWSPSDDNGWRLASVDPLLGDDVARCVEGASNGWTGRDGGALQVYWVRCSSSAVAFAFQNEKWAGLTDTAGLATVFGEGFDRVSRYHPSDSVVGISRSWVQGDLYLNVKRTCTESTVDVCDRATAQYVTELRELVPGEVTENTTLAAAIGEAGWLFLGVPVLTFLLLYVPQRLYFLGRSRGYFVEPQSPDFTAVDSLVRRVRTGRIVRRVILTALVIAAWYVGFWPATELGAWALLYVFLAPFVYFAVFGALLRLVWRPHPLIALARRRARPTPLGVLGAAVRATASMLAGLAVLVYFFASLLLITDRGVTPATVRSQNEAFLQSADPLAVGYAAIRVLVHALDDTGTYFLVFLLTLVVPVTLAYLLDRFAQRIARRSLQATLATDNRPYFVYLRGFDEDRLRIDESVGRRGFLEIFTPFGRPRFEEVLVEYLSRYGPVIAIAGGRQRIPDLGAAKVSLGNDEWQHRVREWSAGARAVIMSATPGEVRAGLEWEMEHVAARTGGIRLMLVVAPWSRSEVARRWAGFLERAQEWELFRPLVERPMPSGVTIMTYSPERGWHGYGARRRWDWAYAASIITAMERGDFSDPGNVEVKPQSRKVEA